MGRTPSTTEPTTSSTYIKVTEMSRIALVVLALAAVATAQPHGHGKGGRGHHHPGDKLAGPCAEAFETSQYKIDRVAYFEACKEEGITGKEEMGKCIAGKFGWLTADETLDTTAMATTLTTSISAATTLDAAVIEALNANVAGCIENIEGFKFKHVTERIIKPVTECQPAADAE